MKKALKTMGMIFLVILSLIVLLFIKAALTPAIPKNYTETVKTGGEIEKRYLRNGSYSVGYYEQKNEEDFKKYEIWYPDTLKDTKSPFPLIVVLNGTGVKASKYKEQFRHFASWGFVVIGTEEEESWDAVAADKSLAFIISQNENQDSIFYQKIDVDNIGAVGHSQGGAGVFNAVTEMEHSFLYKTAVSVSPTHEEQAVSLGWHYDLAEISVPVFMAAGSKGDFEMKLVIPDGAMKSMYDKIASPKVMARKRDLEHGEMLYSADGYITAWFMWQLQGDEAAAKAFTGDDAEILGNELYREQQIDLG
ncbi:MAG: hypothetical protein K6E30_02195 [Lachnospiraceae bacterium]|nr:hypothetical protein [Lachnospiraceae bacterium]